MPEARTSVLYLQEERWVAELEAAQEAQDKAEAAAQGDQGAVITHVCPRVLGLSTKPQQWTGCMKPQTSMLAVARWQVVLVAALSVHGQMPAEFHLLPSCCPSYRCAQEAVAAAWAAC